MMRKGEYQVKDTVKSFKCVIDVEGLVAVLVFVIN